MKLSLECSEAVAKKCLQFVIVHSMYTEELVDWPSHFLKPDKPLKGGSGTASTPWTFCRHGLAPVLKRINRKASYTGKVNIQHYRKAHIRIL